MNKTDKSIFSKSWKNEWKRGIQLTGDTLNNIFYIWEDIIQI